MEDYSKQLMVFITPEQRKRLRTCSAESGCSVSDLVRQWIDGGCGEVGLVAIDGASVARPVGGGGMVVVKEAKPVVEPVARSFGHPVSDEEVPTKRCHKCKDRVTRWTMQSDGKPICDSCKADLEVALP